MEGTWFDPAAWTVRHPTFSWLVLVLLVALGLIAWRDTPRSEDPELDAPQFMLVAPLPGATPEEVEGLVAEPLEERLRAMDEVDEVKATVMDGVAVLNVEFDLSADPDDRYAALLREVDAARPDLPDDTRRIEVTQLRPSEVASLLIAVVSDTAALASLRTTAEALRDAIAAVDGVHEAEIVALADERIEVAIDPDRLAALGLPLGAVLQAVQEGQARIPAGHVETGTRRLSVTSGSPYDGPEDVARTPVAGSAASVLRVGDLGSVARVHEDPLHHARFDGRRAVWVTASYDVGASIFDVRDAALEAVATVEAPDGTEIVTGFDQAVNVRDRLRGFTRDFAIAIGLVLLTLLPLGLRASGIVMLSIPLSLATGLALLGAAGYSINQLSIVGFVIALGLLVDDAIVVVENVSRHLREGASPVDAAIAGTREISLAVLGCTATLLLAFLPLVFLPGTAGMFIRPLPMAVVLTVLASLVISLTLVPLLASRFLKPEGEHGNRALQLVDRVVVATYRHAIDRAMLRPRTTLALAGALVAASLLLVPVVGFSLFPKAGIPQFRVTIDAGDGASLAATDAAVRFVEAELARHDAVVAVLANVGGGNPRVYYNIIPEQERAAVGEVVVRLREYDHHETPALLDELRRTFATWPGAEIVVREYEQGPPIDAPVAVRLVGDDLDTLRTGSAKVADLLRSVPGLLAIEDPLAVPRTDLELTIDREAAALLGVPIAEIARTVRFGLAGLEVGSVRDPDGDDVPIVVRAAVPGEPTPEVLGRLTVASVVGAAVPLADVAKAELRSTPAQIDRLDGERQVTVTALVATGVNTAARAEEVAARLDELELPHGVRAEIAGEAESREESFNGVGSAGLIAAFGIAMVLVLEFGTLRSTLVVASVIPLGIAGGLLALFLTGNTLSFTASVGFVALVGIEVKNSILLVDFTQQLRARGVPLTEAIARAGEQRFLPILLTTATALGGLLPIALEGSALYSPLAWVIIGGLVSSTLLSRIVTPVAYLLLAPTTVDTHPAAA
jgi:multidrug efflux pump subunit AcrB